MARISGSGERRQSSAALCSSELMRTAPQLRTAPVPPAQRNPPPNGDAAAAGSAPSRSSSPLLRFLESSPLVDVFEAESHPDLVQRLRGARDDLRVLDLLLCQREPRHHLGDPESHEVRPVLPPDATKQVLGERLLQKLPVALNQCLGRVFLDVGKRVATALARSGGGGWPTGSASSAPL